MSTTKIRIEGMHCDGCAQRVRRVLEREAGVAAAEVSYEGGEARVQHDEQGVTVDRLRAAIERLGYSVTGDR